LQPFRDAQDKIAQALRTAGIELLPQVDPTLYCVKAAAAVVRAIAANAGLPLDQLDRRGRLAASVFGFAASDSLSVLLGAPFYVVSSIVPLELFGPGYAGELPAVSQAYARLTKQSKVAKVLGDVIDQWVVDPSEKNLSRLGELFLLWRNFA
jgi:hypothetical protein